MSKRAPRVLGVLSQKGGAGKSTLTVHLAVEAARTGERVLILDADPQGSAIAWGDVRAAEHGANGLRVERLEDTRDAQLETQFGDATLILIDFPPRLSGVASRYAGKLNYALVPIGPSAFDVFAIPATSALLTAQGCAFAVVLNRTRWRTQENDARDALTDLDVEIAPLTIGDRWAFARALNEGLAAVEFDPGGAAAAEITSLWQFAKGKLQ